MSGLIGCVTVPRDLLDDEFLTAEPANKRSALRDLWDWANDQPRVIKVNNRDVHLRRGQLAYSLATLARIWRWDREKVRRVLIELQNEGKITVDTTSTITIITVVDYEVFNPGSAAVSGGGLGGGSAAVSGGGLGGDPAPEPPQNREVGIRNKEGGKEECAQPEIPSDEDVGRFCAEFQDLARGISGIPEVWWTGWLANKLSGRGPFPSNWRRALTLAFRSDWVAGHVKARWSIEKNREKNGTSTGTTGGRSVAQARFEISRELELVKERLDSAHELGLPPSVADLELEKKLAGELEGLGVG